MNVPTTAGTAHGQDPIVRSCAQWRERESIITRQLNLGGKMPFSYKVAALAVGNTESVRVERDIHCTSLSDRLHLCSYERHRHSSGSVVEGKLRSQFTQGRAPYERQYAKDNDGHYHLDQREPSITLFHTM